MKLRNKKTGQLGNFIINKDHFECVDLDYVPEYRNLAELNKEWEDYEEPEEDFWYIDSDCETYGVSRAFNQNDSDDVLFNKSIGNYFETKEEAEKAVEKLKAWKRLKNKGFRFSHHSFLDRRISYKVPVADEKIGKDLDLLFGGEE